MIVDRIAKVFEREHVCVWGIGPASQMANEPPGHRPDDVLPGVQSLLCFALPIPRAVYRMPTHASEAVWRAQNLYYRRLDTLSLDLSALLEESGERAVPIWGCMPQDVNDGGEVVGFFNQIRMAEIARIGAIGRNGLLVNSRHGSRLMLGGVVTTAGLPAMSQPESGETGCPQGCRVCVDGCPVHAISLSKKRVNIMRCLAYTSRTPLMPRASFMILARIRPPAAARFMNLRAFDEHTFHVCSQCVALCPLGEES